MNRQPSLFGWYKQELRPLITVSSKHRRISNVLIAYSGSMESAKAMKRFAQLRLWPDANLRGGNLRARQGDCQITT